MIKRRSISERLGRAKSDEVRKVIIADWIADWRSDQDDIIGQFERAIQTLDYDSLCSATGQLKAVSDKRFTGLKNVIKKITDTDQ